MSIALGGSPKLYCGVGLYGKSYDSVHVDINVGNYRREAVGAQKSADFFDPNNEEGMEKRM